MEITFNKGMAGKFNGIKDPFITPKFGRNWFVYFPRVNWNKGKFWKNEVTDASISWLFFWIGITIWGNRKITDEKASCSLIGK